jgi:hypothetical protein
MIKALHAYIHCKKCATCCWIICYLSALERTFTKKADLGGNAGRGKDSQERVKRPWIAPGDPIQSCLSQNDNQI